MISYIVTYRPLRYFGLAIFALLVPVCVGNDPYWLSVGARISLGVIVAVSLRQVYVMGQVTFGHIFFVAAGSYCAALLMKSGVSFWLTLAISATFAGVLGLLVGYATLRLRGAYFSIATMCYGAAVTPVTSQIPGLGGFEGIRGIPSPAIPWTSLSLDSRLGFYYLFLLGAILTVAFFYRLGKSRFGRENLAIARQLELSQSIGVNVTRTQIATFCLACSFAGIAGALYTPFMKVVTPELFTLWRGADFFIYLVFGGIGSVFGPVVGSISIILVSEWMRPIAVYEPLVFGLIVILVIFLLPEGIISIPETFSTLVKRLMQKKKVDPTRSVKKNDSP